MEINVKLYLDLKKYLPEEANGEEVIQFFQERATMGDLLRVVNIPPEDIMVVYVNSEGIIDMGDVSNRELQDGDVVEMFGSIMTGG
ncbi:MoaD/ThiS family protein [Chloroflexota bacterium]